MLDTIRFINAIFLGYAITLSALFLNHFNQSKEGVALAISALILAYLHETDLLTQGYPKARFLLYVVSFTATAFSLLIYFLS